MTSPSRDEILKSLKGAFDRASNGRAKFDRLDDEAKLIEDIGLSSLDLLDLRCELEQQWRIKLADEELAEMHSVADIIRVVQRRTATAFPI